MKGFICALKDVCFFSQCLGLKNSIHFKFACMNYNKLCTKHALGNVNYVFILLLYRLNFPGKIIENGEESASYDVDKGTVLCTALSCWMCLLRWFQCVPYVWDRIVILAIKRKFPILYASEPCITGESLPTSQSLWSQSGTCYFRMTTPCTSRIVLISCLFQDLKNRIVSAFIFWAIA